ncbi:hypothetical protein [Enterovirga rhinocerotis]|uniref:Uncharacterized protein n=1 Tax=Enterovirga rhinocerotis TaxID=1339210 RepID=A0A4R7BKA6_9HYPH|nr:hypothetical protein [Enterovirga rhinocerotis]TDR85463.1 hypothetical protein EV668_4585 [Enterovirga rhinocerotis]
MSSEPADDGLGVPELDDRIAILRGNLRDLVEQASGSLGAAAEELLSERIADQQAELDRLLDRRNGIASKA